MEMVIGAACLVVGILAGVFLGKLIYLKKSTMDPKEFETAKSDAVAAKTELKTVLENTKKVEDKNQELRDQNVSLEKGQTESETKNTKRNGKFDV